ncbi:thioredoxin-like protein [Calocera cornea HHB12733]|uniref:Thioredoxin-like protein n=1 Tax=Calocera cornea HHB12733 TaxID=1353952 RepID=A0A165K5C3_9BASI|nr:thioredoxin-like protein [Calocera cornea HHB12733]
MSVTLIRSVDQFMEMMDELTDRPFAILFWSNSVPSCKVIETSFQQHAKTLGNKMAFYSVDFEDQPDLAEVLSVSAVPAVLTFRGNHQLDDEMEVDPDRLSAMLTDAASRA